MTVSDYRHLKQQIIKGVVDESNPRLLAVLKKLYQKEINSPRRLEEIDTFTKLLSVLELRDVLSEDNVEPLEVIAQKLSNRDQLLRSIAEYKTRHVAREHINFYSAENSHNTTIREPPQSILNSHQFGHEVCKVKLKRIQRIIVEQIGTCWRDLGRNLSGEIRECDLDKIDMQHHSVEAKAHELMLLYEGRADPDRWFMNLGNALERSRRRDLKRLIEEVMTMNIR